MNDTFGATDLLGKSSNRAVFNIGGNTYRMICKYAFGDRKVHLFICWIGKPNRINLDPAVGMPKRARPI